MTEDELMATLAAVVTPQRLWAEIDARRRELGWAWWQVSVALDISADTLYSMRCGVHSQGVCERAPAWLERSRE